MAAREGTRSALSISAVHRKHGLARLVLMEDLKRIQTDRDRSGIDSSNDGGKVNKSKRAEKYLHGPMKTNRPAKRLLVDDEDQDQREEETKHNTGYVCQQTKYARFDQNQFAN